jgi:hypothetical protein
VDRGGSQSARRVERLRRLSRPSRAASLKVYPNDAFVS